MIRTILIALLVSLSAVTQAQLKFNISVLNLPTGNTKKVFVEYFDKDTWKQVKVLDIDVNNKLIFDINLSTKGQYRFRFVGGAKPWTDFLYLGEASTRSIVLEIDYSKLAGMPIALSSSPDQLTYVEVESAYANVQVFYDQVKSITQDRVMLEQQKLNELASKSIQKTELSQELKVDILPLFIHPITLPSDTTYFFKHFLDFTPLNNPMAMRHYAFARSLNQYCNQLYKAYPNQFAMEFSDQIMGRLGENEEVVQYINTYLLDKMVDYKTEDGLSYFLENYVDGCSSQSAFSLSTKNLIQSLKNCEPGKRALELNYPNKSGELTSLFATCKKNKITLVMFWRSNCSHCEEFHPVLEEIYKKYHPKGLEVYAISIDKDQAPWLDFLGKHPYPWIEVYAPNEQRTKLSNNYPAPSTPTLIALDSKGKVISRLIMRSKLENFLEENSSYFQ